MKERRSPSSATLPGSFDTVDGDRVAVVPPASEGVSFLGDRYEDLGRIGVGGMGEVRQVRDRDLDRVVAMKILHGDVLEHPAARARFVEEARTTARLMHPNIAPVLDTGRLADGRVWFTMKEVVGLTFREVIADLHGGGAWTLRRVVNAFHAVCNAVAYAHAQQVVHRDLKPDNLMVGELGEVYVLDWGLAKYLVADGAAAAPAGWRGPIAGTPAYMAPEQARGETARISARSDVYALGAVLYEILSGRPPYSGPDVIAEVVAGPPPALTPRGDALPAELVGACARAMAREPDDRFESARALAAELDSWFDGSRRRDQAQELTRRALAGMVTADALQARAAALRREADARLTGVPAWAPEERKAPAWAAAAAAEEAERDAGLALMEVGRGLHAALRLSPELPEAHAALVGRYLERHSDAERHHRRDEMGIAAALLTTHADALPEEHPMRRHAATYLRGDGALTLLTDPPGATVSLFRYEERNRRLVETFVREIGPTPIRGLTLPIGSWMCVIRHPDREDVRYHVDIARLSHWDAVPPGERDPRPVALPPRGALDPEDVYVPAGWFRAGGDADVYSLPDQRVWVESFVMRRFPVTHREFLSFLDALVAEGRSDEALRFAPRERAGTASELGALVYGFDGARFSLRPDADGDVWRDDWPAMLVDWAGARAFLDARARATGRAWRLPSELEWEKAARGVDGRLHPWGDYMDPSWCLMTDSHEGRRLPAPVDSFPVDESPWGVRGLAGNVQDWCADVFEAGALVEAGRAVPVPEDADRMAQRVVRGGAWVSYPKSVRATVRYRLGPYVRNPSQGFRGVYTPSWVGVPRRGET